MRNAAMTSLLVASLAWPAAAACPPPASGWGPFAPFDSVIRKLRERQPVTIVCLGSSSTQGIGASSPAAAYPAQLRRILAARFPDAPINVINAGIGGETVAANLDRLDRDALAHRPDLVVWQVGTNDALLHVPMAVVREGIVVGLRRIRAAGAQVAVMDPQPLPVPEADAAVRLILPAVHEATLHAGVPMLSRHALMSSWLRSGEFSLGSMYFTDRLHMTDASYRCLAERVADLIPAVSSRRAQAAPLATVQ